MKKTNQARRDGDAAIGSDKCGIRNACAHTSLVRQGYGGQQVSVGRELRNGISKEGAVRGRRGETGTQNQMGRQGVRATGKTETNR